MKHVNRLASAHKILASACMRKPMLLPVVVVMLFLCAGASPRLPEGAGNRVEGKVVNSATGQAVPHAFVSITGVGIRQRATLSEADGTFRFSDLVAGNYWIQAQKPGFYAEPSGSRPVSQFHLDKDVSNLIVKMIPEAIIAGRIVDADHEGLPNSFVGVSAYSIRDGKRHLERRGNTRSDEDGNFRIANLAADDYFLVMGSTSTPPVVSPEANQQDWGYAEVYFPGVEDIASATPVHVTAGQQVDVSFTLLPKPMFHITGKISGMASSEPLTVWFQRVETPFIGVHYAVSPSTGRFMARAPSGNYIAVVRSKQLAVEQPVVLSHDVGDLQLNLAPPISVPVRVNVSGSNGSGDEQRGAFVQILLDPDRWWVRPYAGFAQTKQLPASTDIKDVYPAEYTVRASASNGFRVLSLRCGDTDLFQDKLSVGSTPSPQPIEIVLQDDVGVITATVPVGEATPWRVVAQPTFAPTQAPLTKRSSGAGSVELANVGPGDYNVFLFPDVDGIAYAEPDVLRKFASQASHVHVPPRGRVVVEPQVIRTAR